MPNRGLINTKVIWFCLLVYLLTGLGPVCAQISAADFISCGGPTLEQFRQQGATHVAEMEWNLSSLGTAQPCTPDGDSNALHISSKSRLRISRALANSCTVFSVYGQSKDLLMENFWSTPPCRTLADQPKQSLKQLRTTVLLN